MLICRLVIGIYILETELGPCVPNKKGAPKGELTLRTSVITHGSKGELPQGAPFLFGAHGPYGTREMLVTIYYNF